MAKLYFHPKGHYCLVEGVEKENILRERGWSDKPFGKTAINTMGAPFFGKWIEKIPAAPKVAAPYYFDEKGNETEAKKKLRAECPPEKKGRPGRPRRRKGIEM